MRIMSNEIPDWYVKKPLTTDIIIKMNGNARYGWVRVVATFFFDRYLLFWETYLWGYLD